MIERIVTNTSPLLAIAKTLGLIQNAKPFIEKAKSAGIYYNDDLIESFLKSLGE